MDRLKQVRHPYLFLLGLATLTASSAGWFLTGADTSYLISIPIPGSTPTEVITNVFFENLVIGILTFAALAVGILQYSGEGYNEIEL